MRTIAILAVAVLSMSDVMSTIDECIDQQIQYCEDMICEGELSFDAVIRSTGDAVKICFEQKYGKGL